MRVHESRTKVFMRRGGQKALAAFAVGRRRVWKRWRVRGKERPYKLDVSSARLNEQKKRALSPIDETSRRRGKTTGGRRGPGIAFAHRREVTPLAFPFSRPLAQPLGHVGSLLLSLAVSEHNDVFIGGHFRAFPPSFVRKCVYTPHTYIHTHAYTQTGAGVYIDILNYVGVGDVCPAGRRQPRRRIARIANGIL